MKKRIGIIDRRDGRLKYAFMANELRKHPDWIGEHYLYFEIKDGYKPIDYEYNYENDSVTIIKKRFVRNVAYPKIYGLTRKSVKDKDFRDINYKNELATTLYPNRFFNKGELYRVDYFLDSNLKNKVLQVDIDYERDASGFAVSRTTTRRWVNSDETFSSEIKTTNKNYTINPIEQIIEGKRRRQNIVDNVQIPTLSFMIETMQSSPWSHTQQEILLMGRDFMDSMNLEFKNFVDNSSTVTDMNAVDFGRKKVVVELESRANNDATWLNNTPLQLDITGNTTILDYLVSEFSI